jgi:hypothetical protein
VLILVVRCLSVESEANAASSATRRSGCVA